jgi:hypothetical protein
MKSYTPHIQISHNIYKSKMLSYATMSCQPWTQKTNSKEFHYKEKEIATISAFYCHEYEKNDWTKVLI